MDQSSASKPRHTGDAFLTAAAQEIPVVAETDVLVVGGGAAGIAASIAAARAGARVLLAERYGYLGGLASGGLIILLLTLDDGAGNQVIGGLCQELVERLEQGGHVVHPPAGEWGSTDEALIDRYRRWGLIWGRPPHTVRYSVAFDPENFKQAANDWIGEAGVRLRFHSWAADPLIEDGRISAVVFQTKAGRQAVRARVVVDCTGDGDIFAAAGEAHEAVTVHPWLWFRMGNVSAIDAAIDAARDRFFPTLGGFFFKTPGAGRTLMPWGIADTLDRKIDPLDPDDLTYAEVECRRLVMEVVERLQTTVPGFEKAYLHDVAQTLGITESRRLTGRYVLTHEDAGRSFPDTIGRTGHWTRNGIVYDIPYRCLTPESTSNLLVAGRCISVDRRVHTATKEIPAAMVTGQAAGVAAALAARENLAVQTVAPADLRSALRQQGALL